MINSMINQKELFICYERLRDWGYFSLSEIEKNKIILMHMVFLEYDNDKKEIISKLIEKKGISGDEIISILAFRELWITLADPLKEIMTKIIHWDLIPHFVPCMKNEETEDIDE